MKKGKTVIICSMVVGAIVLNVFTGTVVSEESDFADELALAILGDPTTLVSASYSDDSDTGKRQAVVEAALGSILPTNGPTFALLSTGIAGATPVTTDSTNPGDERGTAFKQNYLSSGDTAELELTLDVPPAMHYLYYDLQFFSSEFPEYVGSQYNDKLTILVDSPSRGPTLFEMDVNSGDFTTNARNIPGSGFDIFAQSGNPANVDWVDTTQRSGADDAGATSLFGRVHPVSPGEHVTISIKIEDIGDNQFDSAVFIDNMYFTGFAESEVVARKTYTDINAGTVECGDIVQYHITISNIGTAPQADDPNSNEFEDTIPEHTMYIAGSATASSGIIEYESDLNRIIWNGGISAEQIVDVSFEVKIAHGLPNNTLISNQGLLRWDSDEDGINDKENVTDDPTNDTSGEDPTVFTVYEYSPPVTVKETFNDDEPRGTAMQSHYNLKWFETSLGTTGNTFEVAEDYHYDNPQSFKTQLRSTGPPQYWYYSMDDLIAKVDWWETWFTCGNSSEESDLILEFLNKVEDVDFDITDGEVIPTEAYHATVTILGSAINYGGQYEMPVTTGINVGSTCFEPWGCWETEPVDANVNDGNNPRVYELPQTFAANTPISISSNCWMKKSSGYSGEENSHWKIYRTVHSHPASNRVYVLRNGDDVPDVQGFLDQQSILYYVNDYVVDDKITLTENQVIYLFEYTSDLGGSSADYQDLVVLITLSEAEGEPDIQDPYFDPAYNYSLLSGGYMKFYGGGTLDVEDGRIHSNNRIQLTGSTQLRAQHVSAHVKIIGSGSSKIHADTTAPSYSFRGRSGVTGTKTTAPVSEVTLPNLDLTPYINHAIENGENYGDNVHLSGSDDIAPVGGIMYVDGDLKISGYGDLTGCFIATGDIDISGSGTHTKVADYPALVSIDGDIDISGSHSFEGLIYAMSDDFRKSGSGDIRGTIIAGS